MITDSTVWKTLNLQQSAYAFNLKCFSCRLDVVQHWEACHTVRGYYIIGCQLPSSEEQCGDATIICCLFPVDPTWNKQASPLITALSVMLLEVSQSAVKAKMFPASNWECRPAASPTHWSSLLIYPFTFWNWNKDTQALRRQQTV